MKQLGWVGLVGLVACASPEKATSSVDGGTFEVTEGEPTADQDAGEESTATVSPFESAEEPCEANGGGTWAVHDFPGKSIDELAGVSMLVKRKTALDVPLAGSFQYEALPGGAFVRDGRIAVSCTSGAWAIRFAWRREGK